MSRKTRKSVNTLIHGIPIQAAPYSKLPLTLKKNIKELIANEVIYVAPAGNYGPLPGTINPFAKFRNSIIVGGAKNDGSDLCSFSSRGIPNIDGYYRPTIVCPSVDLIGRTHSAILPVIESSKKKLHLFTKERYEKQINTNITDVEWTKLKQRFVIGTGTSQAVEYLVYIIYWIIHFRNQRNFVSDQKVIRRLLTNMAVPIRNYKRHEIGAGFVDYKIADAHLKKVDTGNIPLNEREFWSRKYHNPNARFGEIIIQWSDNINDPNQIDFTDGESNVPDKPDIEGIGKIIE